MLIYRILLLSLLISPLYSSQKSYEQQLSEFKKTLPKNFILMESKPFAITGDIDSNWMTQMVDKTIKSCVRGLYSDFFTRKPTYLIKIYLFKNAKSYQTHSKKLFGETPTTPFGYYLSSHRSLVMNISTGSGTLVHELVHALVEEDFPDIPSWFNEGLGSLFEACQCNDDHIRGLVNWRLPILQKGLKNKQFVALRKVMGTTRDEFYEDESGMHYSEARYFCLYMQEKGVLTRFYALFKEKYKNDPTGLSFVEEVFGGKKIENIEREWLKWVQTLHYER